ncbi:MAG: 4-hydroxy-tetrahydrodipicolinate reductase [Bacteroidetes bacterium]|nr:4-hydroxy-tetrahydrodipicolinate reductase [Bacteroidota bacterium]
MKIALIGYGKMGKEIEKAALSLKHEIHVVIDNEDDWKTKKNILKQSEVAIEFTVPSVVVDNLKNCFELGIPVVSGTTGWSEKFNEVAEYCKSLNGSLFYSSNFSIGVNIFMEINNRLSAIMNQYPDYDVKMEEIHHTQKLDAPSGTAITLANTILQNLDRKDSWTNSNGKRLSELEIISRREGTVTGIHEVDWISEIDKISIRHEAYNRHGFVKGALMAAEFLYEKKGIYTMKDLLGF